MLSKVIRRTHMYLALFLFPWVLMYALSTLVMNHRASFVARHGPGAPPYTVERTTRYDGAFSETAPLREISKTILSTLDLDGAHGVSRRPDGTVVITRNDLTTPRRITYSPSDGTLMIERMQYRTNAFLERFHRRRGYATGYGLDNVWAISVDLFIAAAIFWALSGLWMWWEMKVTRAAGLAAAISGAAIIVFYVFAI